MDKTDFGIVMVSGALIIMVIFLFILVKIFGKNKKTKLNDMIFPDIDKIEPHEFQPERFGIRPLELEGLVKEFRQVRELQKEKSMIEIKGGEQKTDKSSIEPEKTTGHLSEAAQITKEIKEATLKETKEETPKEIKEETLKGPAEPIKEISLSQIVIHSIEDNEKLKLEDILIETRDENAKRKARTKRSSSINLVKADKLKESEVPKKKPKKRPVLKKSEKDHIPEQVSKRSEEKSPGKKHGKKVSTKKKKQAIENENPGSGEL